jgi:hypothetical protein
MVGSFLFGGPATGGRTCSAVQVEAAERAPPEVSQIALLHNMVAAVYTMSGGRLKIDILASGAIVNPFEVLDGSTKGYGGRAAVDPLLKSKVLDSDEILATAPA